MADAYRHDLAYIHDAGYGDHARNASAVLIDALRRRGLESGLVVDLGTGSGILAREVSAAGFDVLGIDISPAMIALARERVPQGEFRVGSLLYAELPPCVAVAAVGECLNYLFDDRHTKRRLFQLLRRIHGALSRGGLFLLDIAGPGRIPGSGPRTTCRQADDWAVLVTSEEDPRHEFLTRHITSFRRVGDLYRRDEETHRLRLIDPAELVEELRRIGFRVRVLRGYGPLRFPAGLVGMLARKP